jgi:hypothetical protein
VSYTTIEQTLTERSKKPRTCICCGETWEEEPYGRGSRVYKNNTHARRMNRNGVVAQFFMDLRLAVVRAQRQNEKELAKLGREAGEA